MDIHISSALGKKSSTITACFSALPNAIAPQ